MNKLETFSIRLPRYGIDIDMMTSIYYQLRNHTGEEERQNAIEFLPN